MQVTTLESAWTEVGRDNSSAAQVLLDSKRWRSSVSRSYYAAYSFTTSVLTGEKVSFPADKDGPTHAGLPDLARDNLRKKLGLNSAKELRRILTTLYDARIVADYFPRQKVESDEAIECLKRLRQITVILGVKR